jgi:predicted metal-dependent peptidase
MSKKNTIIHVSEAEENFLTGRVMVAAHPMFSGLLAHAHVITGKSTGVTPSQGLAIVLVDGFIVCDVKKRAEPDVWARALAHCLLHLGFGHFDILKKQGENENLIEELNDEVENFLNSICFGTPLPYLGRGTAGDHVPDMSLDAFTDSRWHINTNYTSVLASGLSGAIRQAINTAAGVETRDKRGHRIEKTDAQEVKEWFISNYPLLGSVAAGFDLVEDPLVCQRLGISAAAVSCQLGEIYINPAAGLNKRELRFVMAHEFLHAALRHDIRHEWRDTYLWNVACDYVINLWLTEMGVGERPMDVLYEADLKGMSAEEVYDRIARDRRSLRHLEKIATLAGRGQPDIIPGDPNFWARNEGIDLDAFYKRALSEGLDYHNEQGRGFLPAGLIEEIRALSHPAIPWDVELARWFEEQFLPLEKKRSYARLSRRQSSTPDIPRPSWVLRPEDMDGRTFGVVLDTSGSMDRHLLASALGAIASYSAARDVPAARVIFCDADAYDQGYMSPDDIAGTVRVRGRGGTVLQPGIDCLHRSADFPKDAPILVITDGYCENRLIFHDREHAFLIPQGRVLPFPPKGSVFRVRNT